MDLYYIIILYSICIGIALLLYFQCIRKILKHLYMKVTFICSYCLFESQKQHTIRYTFNNKYTFHSILQLWLSVLVMHIGHVDTNSPLHSFLKCYQTENAVFRLIYASYMLAICSCKQFGSFRWMLKSISHTWAVFFPFFLAFLSLDVGSAVSLVV